MIRRLLFILFLYILLAWIVVAYVNLSEPQAIVKQGLLYTAIGVAALLLWLILERVVGWFRMRNALQAGKPPKPTAAGGPKPAHEDDTAFQSLLYQAKERLANLETPLNISELPLYVCVGPEGAGKTSVIQNCGIEPTLVAGQISGSGQSVAATRVANLWLAQRSLFLEVSGRIFNSDPARLAEFIAVLRSDSRQKKWQKWFRKPPAPLPLRAVLLFLDAREYTGTPEPSKLDRSASQVRERLSAIAGALGVEFPVYVLFTKTDCVSYFPEFFARLRDLESRQVFGALNPEDNARSQDRVWAEFATKQLNRQFQALFLRLTDRRITALTQELEAGRKPAIYEFPREFKKIRTALVQYLVDLFRPDPLKPSARLRGFFFVGTRKVERSVKADFEATRVFRPGGAADATQIFSPGMMTTIADPGAMTGKFAKITPGSLVDQWIFTTDLFQSVLPQDRPPVRRLSAPSAVGKRARIAAIAAGAVGAVLVLAWTISWVGNLRLVSQVSSAIEDARRGTDDLSLANLQSLDRLRERLVELEQDDSWSLHWGLYTGDSLRDLAHKAYFGRLRRLSLDRINQGIDTHLQNAGTANGGDTTEAIYNLLKTHITITSFGCPVDRTTVPATLKTTAIDVGPKLTPEQTTLLNTQLEFYVSDMEKHNKLPVALAKDEAADAKARDYIQQAGGLEQRLRSLLNAVRAQIKPIPVSQSVENYRQVLHGSDVYDGAFTPKGRQVFEQLVENNDSGQGDKCVMGTSLASSAQQVLDPNGRDRLKSMYYRQYADAWRDFLTSYSVIRYASARDAVTKLEILGSSTSPLLGIVRLVAVNTNFPPPKPGEASYWEQTAKTLGLGSLVQQKDKAQKAAIDKVNAVLGNDAPLMTAADVGKLFQPAIFTTPPDLDRLITEKNQPYINGLRGLQQSLDNYDRAAGADKGGAYSQAQMALAQARMAHSALTDNFSDVGIGLNRQLADLLEQPIRFVPPFLIDPGQISLGKKNGDLKQFCIAMSSTILSKYPFSQNSTAEGSLPDVGKAFKPGEGLVWNYTQGSGKDLVVKQGNRWQPKPDLQGMRVLPELIDFLNLSQQLTNLLYSESGEFRKVQYSLRRVVDPTKTVRLVLDGKEITSQNPLQATVFWPAANDAQQGADGFIENGGLSAGFGSYKGLWGVFKLFQFADAREIGAKGVVWSYSRGLGSAAAQPITPPAKVDFVDLPGNNLGQPVDLFNPKFFQSFTCPRAAVAAN